MEREIRYCTTEDGVRIAYCVEGTGPALLLCPILAESFSFDDIVPEIKEFARRLGEGRTLVRYDMRGIGLSDRNPNDVSHAAQVLDLEAVVASAAPNGVVILAPSTSGPCAITFSVKHPDLVESLILYGTTGRGRDVMPPENMQGLTLLARSNWTMASHTLSDMAGREEFPSVLVRYAEWYRMSADGDMVARILEARYEADVMDILPRVACPTLVLHRPRDPIFPFRTGQALAAGIPGARIVPLPGTGHNMALGESDTVLRAIEGFLNQTTSREGAQQRREVADSGRRAVRTILFTDLVGHTAMMQRLGDAEGREVLREHERITRDALEQRGGTEVKTTGDGFLASFSSVTDAVECAIALQRSFAERNVSASEPLHIRVGMNAGEPIEDEGDLFGTTVILAARIAAKAEGGQILASLAVRELCAGKRFLFADLGDHVLRGFEDPVRIFGVSPRE
jgi:class 3 adenylate cyclase